MDEGQLDGQVGSISDELAPPPAPEAADAVADFDGGHPQDAALPEVQPEPIAPAPEPQFAQTPTHEPASQPASEPVAHDNEKHAPRRSTVREKVTFASSAPASDVAAPVAHSAPEPTRVTEPAPEEAAPSGENAPRKAGWWSRRFGGGE
jgi:ribonuclease E